mgnify:CR=1 FL=1
MKVAPLSRLDHVVIAVRNLDEAAKTYRSFGFTLTPRGLHEGKGTGNHCLMFPNTYVELLGVVDAAGRGRGTRGSGAGAGALACGTGSNPRRPLANQPMPPRTATKPTPNAKPAARRRLLWRAVRRTPWITSRFSWTACARMRFFSLGSPPMGYLQVHHVSPDLLDRHETKKVPDRGLPAADHRPFRPPAPQACGRRPYPSPG